MTGTIRPARWVGCGAASKPRAKRLSQRDDDPFRTAHVTEPVEIHVLRHLANQLATMVAQAGNDVVETIDREHDAAKTQRVGRRVPGAGRRRRAELRQLDPAVAIRSL